MYNIGLRNKLNRLIKLSFCFARQVSLFRNPRLHFINQILIKNADDVDKMFGPTDTPILNTSKSGARD